MSGRPGSRSAMSDIAEEPVAASLTARCVAEFVGTFMLVFTIGCNVLSRNATFGGLSVASVLTVMVYTLGGISGAHFNPAVSVMLGFTSLMGGDGLDSSTIAIYCGVQILAGIVAGFAFVGLFDNSFALGPASGFSLFEVAVVEFMYTLMLCFVVANVAVARKNLQEHGQYFGLAIGYVIVAGAYGGGRISWGCFNPAVAAGIDVSSWQPGMSTVSVYIVSEILGSATAAVLFAAIRPQDFGRTPQFPIIPKLVSEFLGTYFLVLTVGLNVLGKSPAGPVSIAAALMCMIYAVGDVSGAHFNPAVTVALLASGKTDISPVQAVAYVATQLGGAIVAGLTYVGIYGRGFSLGPGGKPDFFAVAAAELIFTFVLVYVVLCAVLSRGTGWQKNFAGLIVGSCVTVGGFAAGGVSGGYLNPAVAFAIGVTSGTFMDALMYFAVEIVAGILAVGAFLVTHAADYSKESEKLTA
eukprot:TRINITY_DN3217_c0_g2_i1.p1 TRINITY_DN3217_c0_g2~~TRINITY_DN3217_c0_g2_i1.p1  ORF type:complete len:468 (+),score=89.41 TRINITY_DN3217_c0_g2_i1:76-1479(+)